MMFHSRTSNGTTAQSTVDGVLKTCPTADAYTFQATTPKRDGKSTVCFWRCTDTWAYAFIRGEYSDCRNSLHLTIILFVALYNVVCSLYLYYTDSIYMWWQATQARRQIQAVSATRTGARPVHDEELVRELLQQVEGLVQEQTRKDEQLENLQRSLNDKDALLREENQRVISLERSSNVNDALLQEANQRVISLERSSNDKDALLRVANQRVEGLQRSLNGLQTQLQEANQSLNFKDAQLLEANRRAASLQSDLERQERDTQSLQQDVRDMRFVLSDAEARIAEGRQGIQESDVLRIASRDIRLTNNKLGHGSYGGLVRPLITLSLLGNA